MQFLLFTLNMKNNSWIHWMIHYCSILISLTWYWLISIKDKLYYQDIAMHLTLKWWKFTKYLTKFINVKSYLSCSCHKYKLKIYFYLYHMKNDNTNVFEKYSADCQLFWSGVLKSIKVREQSLLCIVMTNSIKCYYTFRWKECYSYVRFEEW